MTRTRRPLRRRTTRTSRRSWTPSSRARWRASRTERHQDAAQLHEALRAFLPPGFLPEPALAALLARHFDVTRERRMLAAEVSRATRALPGARAVDQPVAERPPRARAPHGDCAEVAGASSDSRSSPRSS